jgi:hypothetical protein
MKILTVFSVFTLLVFTNANAQWSVRIDGAGTATITGNTAFIASADSPPLSGIMNEITGIGFTSSGTQTVTFNYSFTTNDPGFDEFFYSINGSRTNVTKSDNNGSIAVNVPNGSAFFMGIDNDDGCCGTAQVTITNLVPAQRYITLSSPVATLTSNCTILAPSAATTFDVTGSSLSSTVTVSAPTGFEISASQNSGYASSLSLTPDGAGTVSSTLYVRLSAGYGGGISGTITASSAGATTQTTTVSSTTVAPPSFSRSGPFSICNEATYLVALATPNAYNGWSTSDPNVFSVNSAGYITATASGTATATITYTDACGQSVSQTVNVVTSDITTQITGNRTAYKFNGNPQGPTLSGSTINYVGYDGYSYYGQNQPTQVGYYKANIQLGNEAGCPNRFYIFKCTTCNN